ncbi:cell division protein FtsK [Allosaccharopolyspora coralli]|uniref:Cell division protein FtsK n=1 Tax=Allosaccharopolyspora coralli TaxID=2665642 RepID=A0A5Q3Q2A1_9PSEU|nr:FtsK/SpoIIIE domain-containing protein [Allosaccharopolyspora coralli]QGK68612.1 cell division protein FtsK [Allosaccharopolyspora coralli]
MRPRNERRSRVQSAYEGLRTAIAAALGSADAALHRARSEHGHREFALRIAEHGVCEVAREPALLDESTEAAPKTGDESDAPEHTTEVLPAASRESAWGEAVRERDECYADWTAYGPQELTSLVDEVARGSAGLPWRDWLGTVGSADTHSPPELWRLGEAHVPDAADPSPFPVAVPLLDESHLHVSTDDTGEAAEGLVQNLLLRVLSQFRPGLVRVHVWDVAQLTGTLPGLHPLTRSGLVTMHDPTRLDDLLDELSEHIRRIHTGALLGGHTSLRSFAAETGHRGEPWRIAVLFGDGQQLPDEQQQKLHRVARSGLDCGIQLVAVNLRLSVNSAMESVHLNTDGARCSMSGPAAVMTPDPPMPRKDATRACKAISERFVAQRSRVRGFDDLVPEQLWACRSTTGLQAPVGFREGEPVWLTLGDASPHALVGGPSGSGKTNFLYGMIGAFTARYSPDELELYLLDFKEGVSFSQFTPGTRDPSWLPHANVVGVNVNADREFGLALLKFLADEMRRRADAAKAHEVTKLEELRAQDPEGRWPRIVAVIDEFQYLFAERDPVSSQATALLEDVARRGRSQGIHLVLASQDVSGIEAFWGKPAVFEQFILRIALPKARRVLVQDNSAAVELPRWHAVVNHESGVRHGNEVARLPDATAPETMYALQQRLWEARQPSTTRPRLFDGSHLPRLSRRPRAGLERSAVLGQVIDVEGTPAAVRLDRSPGRNIAVLGSVRVDASNVLGAAALSLGQQYAPGTIRFTIAGLVDEVAPAVGAVVTELRAAGHEVDHVGLDDATGALDRLAAVIDERSTSGGGAGTASGGEVTECLLLYAADAAHTTWERKDPASNASGLDRLRTILKQGPELRVHTVGWWRSVQRLKHSLGMGPVDDIGAWLAFDVHGSELTAFAAGQPVNWSPRARRGLFFDRSLHSRPEVVLPFELDTRSDEITMPSPRAGDGTREESRD